MDTYKGHIEYRLAGQGSKSEGFVASLITSAGISYRLYRKGAFEINDSFFKPFDQQEVEIRGELEDTGFICVVSVELSDGKFIPVPGLPSLPSDLAFHPEDESEDGASDRGEENQAGEKQSGTHIEKEEE